VQRPQIGITLRVYGHLLPSMQQEAVDKWEGVFREVEEEDKGNVADSQVFVDGLRQEWDMPSPRGTQEYSAVSKTTICSPSPHLRRWIRV
jgi:hypothetical protein